MSDAKICPACGRQIPSLSPGGLCPQCLLKAGVGGSDPRLEAARPSRSSAGFVPPEPAELADRFPQLEILELLGKGGMGAVYKARQRGLDRLVALKILPPEISRDPTFTERFLREARALAKLSHRHIVAVYDFGQAEGLCFFLMEYIDGVNLRQALQAGKMQPRDALAVVPQICDALQFAHDEGVVHRDIKPENILVDKRGRVKIADFGLAKLLDQNLPDQHLTGTQQVMGTLRYMAPEQLEGSHAVDHRADIFSLGVVFYELLTGELPIGRFAPPSKKVQIDVRLDEVVLRALEKEPELRYQHASDVKTQVEAICGLHPAMVNPVYGREYRSQAEIFGWPWVHVAFGIDPQTGKARVAKGVIAIGNAAVGVVAIGGMACGGLCVGGMGLGLVSFAGLSIGLWLAMGGCAIGLFAMGGLAMGAVAVGGCAVGYFAAGGGGWGVHPLLSYAQDPVAVKFFSGSGWPRWLGWMSILTPVVFAAVATLTYLARTKSKPASAEARTLPAKKPLASSPRRPWLVPVIATLSLIFAVLLLLVTAAEDVAPLPEDSARIWKVWSLVEQVLGFAMATALFVASIGLYLWQPWARKLMLGVCIFGLASLVVDMPYLARAVIPHTFADMKASFASDFTIPEELDAIAGVATGLLFGSTLLAGLVFMVGGLIYFTRPQVIAAFEDARN